MKVSFLDGPSLADRLPRLIGSCKRLDIAMAYVKINGLRVLLKNSEALLNRGASVRIVFGLSSKQGITDKESAESLLELSRRKQVDVRKINHSGFHPKLFIFDGDNPCIVVGSANLTEAAQSTNAEANILVEDADAELMNDAKAFFEYYFNTAPKLKRSDVDLYEPRKPRKGRVTAGGLEEDYLPSPQKRKHELEKLRPKKIWKIAPGEDAYLWDEWLKSISDDGEGIVAIGWDFGNLNNYKSYGSLRKAVKQYAKERYRREGKRTRIKYVTDQLWAFKTDISKGDVFVVYSETRVLGVAEVTDDSKYSYKGNRNISYENQINVRYKWYKQWPTKASKRIIKTLGKQGTLLLVEEDWFWDHLVKNLP